MFRSNMTWLNGRTSGHPPSLRCPGQQKGQAPRALGKPMTVLLCLHCFSQGTSFATLWSKSEFRKSPHRMHDDFQKNQQKPKVEERSTEIPQSPLSRSLQAELLLPSRGSFLRTPHEPQNCNHPLTSLSTHNAPSLLSAQQH